MSENTEILLEKSYHFDRYLSSSNPGFQDLTLTEKALVREILSSKLDISSLNEIIYDRKPPTIEEFLKDPKYLGEHLNKQLYPIWKEEMAEYHDANNTQKEWILSGSSGSGKTTAARVSALYSIYRILCLRYPAQILNIIDSDLIVCSLLTLTLAKAELALIAPFVNMLTGSEMFEQVTSRKDFANYSGEKIPFQHSGSVIKLPKNFVIMPGSQESHAVGLNIPIAMLDEAEARGGGVSEILSMWAEIKTRINNRFKISRFTSLYMMSSSKTINGVVSSYMKNLRPGWQSRIRYTAKAVWEVKPKDYNLSGKTFPVLRGTPTHPSKILNGEEVLKKLNGTFTVPSNCDLLEIPVEFENEFYELGVNKALQDIVGITTNTDDMPFDFLDNLEVEFLPELFNLKAPAEDNKPLIELLPRNIFDDISGRLSRYWDAPRYCHLDLAVTSEAGISVCHKELTQEGRVVYVYDFICWVTADTRIDFLRIYDLFVDLKTKAQVNFEIISADQFQSTQIRQMLEKQKIATQVNYLSVDRTATAYDLLSKAVHKNEIKVGKCPYLKKQLENIGIDRTKNHVYTVERKDIADSFCGSYFNAFSNSNDIPTNLFKDQVSRNVVVDLTKYKRII